ncbi:MAG: hypothetical protein QXI58_01590 [Candidatus Micrarchaeia archaeon]
MEKTKYYLFLIILCCIAIIILISYYVALNNQYNNLLDLYMKLDTKYRELDLSFTNLKNSYSNLETSFTKLNDDYKKLSSEYLVLQEEYRELETHYRELQLDYTNLKNNYVKLQDDYNKLDSEYKQLLLSQEDWKNKYNSLNEEYVALKAKYEALQKEEDELKRKISDLEYLIKQYESVPHKYYDTDLFHSSGKASELLDVLRQAHKMLSRDYKVGIFDCSESSAFIEWVLEDAGYDAYIAVGPAPWDPKAGYHAWVLAYTTDGYVAAIECTITTSARSWIELELLSYGIIYGNDPNADGYYKGYDKKLKNIYIAIRDSTIFEWNWWEGYWGFD